MKALLARTTLTLLLLFAIPSLSQVLTQTAPLTANVDCGDGFPVVSTVDNNTVNELQVSIQGMLDNPSGMTCVLTLPTAPASSQGFVVGGGRYDRAECPINFSLSGHVDTTGAHGTQTATITSAQGAIPGCPGEGHIKANVTCVAIKGNVAEVRGVIMEQTGSLGPQFFPPGDTVFVTDVVDIGEP